MVSDELLRRDVRILGEMLGDVIREQVGATGLELVERIRLLARERRTGAAAAERHLAQLVQGLSFEEARVVARAFSMYFDVANIAEDRHRVRVLREREARYPHDPVSESAGAAIRAMREHGLSAAQAREKIEALAIELVFTAHPSEAKRRSIRAKLRRMRVSLQELDREDLLARERQNLLDSIRAELTVLWKTEFLHPTRPRVSDEVERGVSIMSRIWEVVPQVYQAMRVAWGREYPAEPSLDLPRAISFGFWMGGDRDGHLDVTWEVTAATFCRLRHAAIELHLEWCARLFGYLTIALPIGNTSTPLAVSLRESLARWPELEQTWTGIDASEGYRRWLRVIQWRLRRSYRDDLFAPPMDGAYRDGDGLSADIELIGEALARDGDRLPLEQELRRWLDLARTFGLHLAHLDVRQDSRRYQEIVGELLREADIHPEFSALEDEARCELLAGLWGRRLAWEEDRLTPLTRDTLQLYRLLCRGAATFGGSCLGGSVISLTRRASDVMSVLWLWQWAVEESGRKGAPVDASVLRVVPLFEQIEDLRRAPVTLRAILSNPIYRDHLSRQGGRQWVMIGYSDSTKDGGYFAANWGLYRAQETLHEVARSLGVQITFFHGRGGSLGRGGGPAARGILSLPPESLDGTLRLTEQGEVLAERYDDPQIAYRHLEQVLGAVLTGASVGPARPEAAWCALMETMAARSRVAYRELVDEPTFMGYFETASPIEEIEDLPIASRPARRRGERSLADLRAIPWVFAWTQNRSLIPAWYGLGTALGKAQSDGTSWELLKAMYRTWPFFQAVIDNASLALAKSDMYVAEQYARLEGEANLRQPTWQRIVEEFQRSRLAILDLTGRTELLANIPWFQRSIDVRNPYVDPLNLIQIEFLRRRRMRSEGDELAKADAGVDGDLPSDAIRDLLRLTVQGIAAGMRTTG